MVPYKTCSFDCLYCELGKTSCHTSQRQPYLDLDVIGQELKEQLSHLEGKVDYITLAGSGEPTLNKNLGELVSMIKGLSSIPVAILTNSSLLPDPEVRKELQEIDLIVPSLDAVSQDIFEHLNHPVAGLQAEAIIESLIALRKEFRGHIWLEVLFCQGINDSLTEVQRLHEAVETIRPDLIQINTVFRPPAIEDTRPCTSEQLDQIAQLLGPKAQVVGQPHPGKAEVSQSRSFQKRIQELLRRRPCTLDDIAQITGLNRAELIKVLDGLTQAGLLQRRSYQDNIYYHCPTEGLVPEIR
ncbi:MAG: radical SAM protein [bacterium]